MSTAAIVITFLTVLSGIGFVFSYTALDALARAHRAMTEEERKAIPGGKVLAVLLLTSIFAGWLITAVIIVIYQAFAG